MPIRWPLSAWLVIALLRGAQAQTAPAAPEQAPAASSAAAAGQDALDLLDFNCSAPAPSQRLNPDAYAAYSFEKIRNGEAHEVAALAKGLELEIASAGCRDEVSVDFVFRIQDPAATAEKVGYWLKFVSDQLGALKAKDNDRRLRDVRNFLKIAADDKPSKDEKALRIDRCKLGPRPTREDDCPVEAGGGYHFILQEHPRELSATAGVYGPP